MPTLTRQRRGKYGVSFSGLETLSRALARDGEVWQRVKQAAVRGMIENTEDLLGRAMRDAPVDEGTLRASGTATVYANGRAVARRGFREIDDTPVTNPDRYVMQTRNTVQEGGLGDAIVGEVGFNTPYALTQHERIDFSHPKGGKAKYLEEPLKEHAGRYQENLEEHLREALS